MTMELLERQRIYGVNLNIYPVKPVADKVTRAMQVQSIAQEGRVHFNKFDKNQQELLSELTMFTGSQNYHDDLNDAFVMGLQEIKNWSGHQTKKNAGPTIVLPPGRRNPLTGRV